MLDLSGKWALVTGASRGIGHEIALALADQGVNIVVHSRDARHTETVVREIESRGVKALAVSADLADAAAVRSMADEVLGAVDVSILCNDAGIQLPAQHEYWRADAEQYACTYAVNVIAPMILIEKFLPGMIARGFGRILNTTSGILNQPEQGAYAASKGALNKTTLDLSSKFVLQSGATDAASTDVASTGAEAGMSDFERARTPGVARVPDITVNVVDPGWIRTDLGGPEAPASVESVVPGMIAAAFAEQKLGINGKWISAQDYVGLPLAQAVGKLPAAAYLAVTS